MLDSRCRKCIWKAFTWKTSSTFCFLFGFILFSFTRQNTKTDTIMCSGMVIHRHAVIFISVYVNPQIISQKRSKTKYAYNDQGVCLVWFPFHSSFVRYFRSNKAKEVLLTFHICPFMDISIDDHFAWVCMWMEKATALFGGESGSNINVVYGKFDFSSVLLLWMMMIDRYKTI